MDNKKTKLEIVSYENIKEDYLRLHIQQNNRPCGTVDFISDKINFTISCQKNFFKGMETIRNCSCDCKEGALRFMFNNKQQLTFRCCTAVFEHINQHIQQYGNTDKSSEIKNAFFEE
ncbi:hypothetical protein [Empedobacter brevis]|uniref:hypothetical protein n=1 Tax=Empedobacter brevis TaxID=247 RepID=UPI00289EABE5|nr:hypothetical protein [Empedobacter brevis]